MIRGGGVQALASMGKLLGIIEKLSSLPARTAVLAAPKITRLLQTQYRTGADSYGTSWRALKPSTLAKGRTPPPLTDTRVMRDGTAALPRVGGRAGLMLVVGAMYGRFHQTGTRYMASRQILPQRGMPSSWHVAMTQAAKQAGQEALTASRLAQGGASE